MIRDRGYAGGVEQLRRLVACLRPQPHEAFLRLQVFPAEQAQVDWAYFGSVIMGRAKRQLSCFVITLSWSRALYLECFSTRRRRTSCVAMCVPFKLDGLNVDPVLTGFVRGEGDSPRVGTERATRQKFRLKVLRLVWQKYLGEVGERFGPTLAAEHLGSEDGMEVHRSSGDATALDAVGRTVEQDAKEDCSTMR